MRLAPLVLVALAGCSKPPEPEKSTPVSTSETTPNRSATPSDVSRPAAPAKPDDVGYDTPATWEKSDSPTTMRKATYKIPRAAGDPEDAELSVSQAGGTVSMNVQRWERQFQDRPRPATTTMKRVGDFQITLVEIHGTFAGGGMPGAPPSAPKKGFAMLAAIVDTRVPTFFKLTGPDKTVAAAKPDFDKLVDSFRAK